jgi:aldehyde dehydrogenase (NAD+)
LIDTGCCKNVSQSIEQCKQQGGNFIVEGGVVNGEGYESGCYVKPCIAEAKNEMAIVQHETFAPYFIPDEIQNH